MWTQPPPSPLASAPQSAKILPTPIAQFYQGRTISRIAGCPWNLFLAVGLCKLQFNSTICYYFLLFSYECMSAICMILIIPLLILMRPAQGAKPKGRFPSSEFGQRAYFLVSTGSRNALHACGTCVWMQDAVRFGSCRCQPVFHVQKAAFYPRPGCAL